MSSFLASPRRSPGTVCSERSTPIAAATTSSPPRMPARSTGRSRPRSAARSASSASPTSRPIHRRAAGAWSGCSGRRRSCAWPGSRPWRPPTATCGNASCPTTMPASRRRPPSPGRPSCPMPAGRSRTCCASERTGWSAPTIACLQPPQPPDSAQRHRPHYVRATVRVHQYPDGSLAIFDGPRCIARFDPKGQPRHVVSQAA